MVSYRVPSWSKRILAAAVIFCTAAGIFSGRADAQESSPRLFLTMEEAIDRALSENHMVRASEFALKKARWDKANAWTQFLPDMSFNTQMTRIDDETFALRDFRRYLPPELKDQIPQTVFQRAYFTSFDVSMPVFNGAVINGLFIAGSNVNMAKKLRQSTEESTVFQVVSAYLNVLKSREILNLQEEYLELSGRNFDKAERLYEAGRYSKTDMLRWKLEYQQQKSVVVSNGSLLRSSMVQLKRLLNIDTPGFVEIEGELPENLISESEKLAGMTDEAILGLIPLQDEELIQSNSALSAARSGTRTSQSVYRNAYMTFLPSLTASYSYGWRENSTLALDDYSPQIFMMHFSVPVFSGLRNLTTMRASYFEYKQAKEDFDDQLEETRLYITEAVNRILNLKTLKELAGVNTEFADHNYRVVEQQNEKGLVSNIDFVDAKLNLQNARLEEINTQYDFIVSMVELYFMIGKINTIIE